MRPSGGRARFGLGVSLRVGAAFAVVWCVACAANAPVFVALVAIGLVALMYGVWTALRMAWSQRSLAGVLVLLTVLVWGLAIFNLLVFHGVAAAFGGTVEGGRIVAHRYFLGSNGRYAEVSRDTYDAMARYGRISEASAGGFTIGMLIVVGAGEWIVTMRSPKGHNGQSGG